MSSIYKKGRDGYFYYQTYLFNPKTRKKDKRIFHSLGTKDKKEALKKQIILDNKYSEKISGSKRFFNLKINIISSLKIIKVLLVVYLYY